MAAAGAEGGYGFGLDQKPPTVPGSGSHNPELGGSVTNVDVTRVAPDDERIVGGADKLPDPAGTAKAVSVAVEVTPATSYPPAPFVNK